MTLERDTSRGVAALLTCKQKLSSQFLVIWKIPSSHLDTLRSKEHGSWIWNDRTSLLRTLIAVKYPCEVNHFKPWLHRSVFRWVRGCIQKFPN